MIHVAPAGRHHASRCLADSVKELQCDIEDVGCESAEVFVGEHVVVDRIGDDAVLGGRGSFLAAHSWCSLALAPGRLLASLARGRVASQHIHADRDGDVGIDR